VATPPTGITANHTDLANAEQLVKMFGPDLGYVGSWQKPISWDGKRWAIDDSAKWNRCAAHVARVIYADGTKRCKDDPDDDYAKAVKAWGKKSQSIERLSAMVRTAQLHVQSIRIASHKGLNANPWLLNVQNGTLNLQTGKLQAHNRKDWITKIAPVKYDEKAVCPVWDRFLKKVTNNDRDLMEYLQRVVGYALTGEVSEHVLFFFYGGGKNGKSTFLNTISSMLGEYAFAAPRGLLFKQQGSQHDTRFATLHGCRFVTCSEIEEGQMFDEALTKDLTGGDPISARRMREDHWEFIPTHKLFMAGNHKPAVRGADEGIWRRIRLVPWLVQITEKEKDVNLKKRLLKELPGILRWAVQGCLAWQKRGLDMPAIVQEATAQYRDESDVLGQFLNTNLTFTANVITPRYIIRELYEAYCKENGFEPLGARRFSAALREKGATDTVKRHLVEAIPYGPNARDGGWKVVNAWRGVRLTSDNEKLVRPVEEDVELDDEPEPKTTVKPKPKAPAGSPVLTNAPANDDGDDPPPPPPRPRPTTPKTTLQAVRQSPGAGRNPNGSA
jgi:putative DNA primase/helicase